MKEKIDSVLGYLLVALMVIITLDVLWGVFTRYALGSQASWTEELARFLLVWIGILGAAYAAGQKIHLSINLLEEQLSEKGQRQLKIILTLLILAFVLPVMVIGGGRLVYITQYLKQLSPALQIPMAIVYTVIPISGLLITYYKILELARLRKGYQ